MTTTKIRSLLWKGAKFICTSDNQLEFDKVIASLSDLDKLEPFNPEHDMCALVDASLLGLGFILFPKG